MRVITGSARGRKLKEITGMDIRPTTDKVKESIFNIVQFDVEGRRVLDLFGGTGQLGIEALSRGAEKCVFVDQSREAVKVIRENVALTGFENQSRIVQGDAISFLTSCLCWSNGGHRRGGALSLSRFIIYELSCVVIKFVSHDF